MEFKGYPLDDYMKVEEKEIKFPREIEIAYAVCSEECGNAEFIVDGSSQVCQFCGRLMFRTSVKKYILADSEAGILAPGDVDPEPR